MRKFSTTQKHLFVTNKNLPNVAIPTPHRPPVFSVVTHPCFPPQSAEAGERNEHEPERKTGRAPTRRQAPRDHRRPLRDPHPAAGADQVGGVLPVRGVGGQEGHGGHQARTGHGAAGEGGDRGAQGVRRQAGGAHAQEEVAPVGTSKWHR